MLIREKIQKVRAVEIPAGIWQSGKYFSCNRFVLIKWESDWSDKLYQVYVNSRLSAATTSTDQRQLIVPVSASFSTAVCIEVFAVESSSAHIDFSNELANDTRQGRVKLRILRSQTLPIDSTVTFYFDNASGVIDYDNPLNAEPIPVWPSPYDKGGFGMSQFGNGDLGFCFASAVGFGSGDFGLGMFGADSDSIEWISQPLSKGIYKFAVMVTDINGNKSLAVETEPVIMMPYPIPAKSLDVISFDDFTNQLTLNIN